MSNKDFSVITQQHCLDLAVEVGALLVHKGDLLCTAESCTGGWLAKCCTDCIGSSKWFDYSIVSYSYTSKQKLLHIEDSLLEQYGAVDEQVVLAMAKNSLGLSQANYSVAISGIAGPKQETNDHAKPVGMVCFAWAKIHNDEITADAETQYFAGSREQVRIQSVYHALLGLKQILIKQTLS